MKSKKSISIVIPVFNEKENISWVVKDTLKKLPNYFKNFEIIVVDDGSIDGTEKIVDNLVKKNKVVKVIHQKNSGYSKAMLSGIMAAKKDYVAYMPADGQFLVDDMRHGFEVMQKADLILGYRGGRPDYTTKRMFFSYGYLLFLALLFKIKYMDVGWVNIWKTKKVQGLDIKKTQGIFLLTEIVVRFEKLGYKILEAPSYYRVRRSGEVKNAKFKVVWNTFLNAIYLWLRLKLNKL